MKYLGVKIVLKSKLTLLKTRLMCNNLIIWLFLFVTELRQSSEWSQRPANLNELPACSFLCFCKQVAGSSVTPIMTGRSIAAKPPVSSILGRLSVGEAASVRGERNECEASSHPVTAPSRFFCQLCLPGLPVGLHLQGVVGVLEDGGAWRLRYTCVANQVQLFYKKKLKMPHLCFVIMKMWYCCISVNQW